MINLLKKHWLKITLIVLLIAFDSLIIAINFISAKKDITAPGGLNEVRDLIEVEGNDNIEGSFNTIYVYSYEKASILQTYIASFADYNEISDSSTTTNLTYEERHLAGQIQKNSSIEGSLICAYNYANKTNKDIKIEYSLGGFLISNRQINQSYLEIGDLIYGVIRNNVTYGVSDPNKFVDILNNLKIGDTILIIRDEKTTEYTLNEEISSDNLNRFSAYAKYNINEETIFPKYTLHKSNTLGPSGGLLQTLSVYCQITGIDLTHGKKVCGTGTISVSGKVGAIGGISQKVVTALRGGADVFICPKANSDEGLKAYLNEKDHEKMKFIIVETFEEAVVKLGELYEN